jgi:hypothetical protein
VNAGWVTAERPRRELLTGSKDLSTRLLVSRQQTYRCELGRSAHALSANPADDFVAKLDAVALRFEPPP